MDVRLHLFLVMVLLEDSNVQLWWVGRKGDVLLCDLGASTMCSWDRVI